MSRSDSEPLQQPVESDDQTTMQPEMQVLPRGGVRDHEPFRLDELERYARVWLSAGGRVSMTRGKHVIEEECDEIRRLKGRGAWDEVIAAKMDISRPAVYYHVAGKCDHPPPPDGLLGEPAIDDSEN